MLNVLFTEDSLDDTNLRRGKERWRGERWREGRKGEREGGERGEGEREGGEVSGEIEISTTYIVISAYICTHVKTSTDLVSDIQCIVVWC